jgi:hypothetical protein
MIVTSSNKYLADLASAFSDGFTHFSIEAIKLSVLLARAETPVSPETNNDLREQCIAEVQVFEEYLNRKEEVFAYLKVKSR